MIVLLALAVFATSAGVDYAHGRYVERVVSGQRHAAAAWSVVAGAAGSVGFVLAVKVTMWLVIAELCGLYVGTLLAARGPAVPTKCRRTNL